MGGSYIIKYGNYEHSIYGNFTHSDEYNSIRKIKSELPEYKELGFNIDVVIKLDANQYIKYLRYLLKEAGEDLNDEQKQSRKYENAAHRFDYKEYEFSGGV